VNAQDGWQVVHARSITPGMIVWDHRIGNGDETAAVPATATGVTINGENSSNPMCFGVVTAHVQ
jgi:hypothetical protein